MVSEAEQISVETVVLLDVDNTEEIPELLPAAVCTEGGEAVGRLEERLEPLVWVGKSAVAEVAAEAVLEAIRPRLVECDTVAGDEDIVGSSTDDIEPMDSAGTAGRDSTVAVVVEEQLVAGLDGTTVEFAEHLGRLAVGYTAAEEPVAELEAVELAGEQAEALFECIEAG